VNGISRRGLKVVSTGGDSGKWIAIGNLKKRIERWRRKTPPARATGAANLKKRIES